MRIGDDLCPIRMLIKEKSKATKHLMDPIQLPFRVNVSSPLASYRSSSLVFQFFSRKSLHMGQGDSRPLPAQFALAPGGAETGRVLPRDVLLMVLDRVEGLATFAACLRSCRLFYNHLNREQAWARQLALVAEREFPGRTKWTGYQLEPVFLVSLCLTSCFCFWSALGLSFNLFFFFLSGRRLGFFSQLSCGDWYLSGPCV